VAAEVLPPSVAAGDDPIYVLGDPLWYLQLQRRQAVEIHGWSPQYLTPAMWSELERELRRSRPAVVFVDAYSAPYVERRAPGILALLRSTYTQAFTRAAVGGAYDAGAGTWWVTSDTGQLVPTREGNLLTG
jgi:hypothetical protein